MGGGGVARPRLIRAYAGDESGQTVVLMALTFTVMLGFAALAIDVGRFYAERRFLQDSVDAAALACARAYSQGGATSTDAYNAAKTILLTYNLPGSPGDLTYSVPDQGNESYYENIVEAQHLKDGILPQTSPYLSCRVAVYIDVPTTLLKIANPGLQTLALNARAYAIAKGGLVPVVVPKYSNGPGPGNGDPTNFIHHTMAQNFDYQCTVGSDTGCTAASSSSKGREFVLFGASQKATNDNSFRGYIAPDIRDFQTETFQGSGILVHTAYNGVAADASINVLKDFEANWIREGYPGPDICVVSATSFLPCAEVAVINGASAGIFVPEVRDRYRVGDMLLAQLYDGTVKTIPNFTISYPTLLIGASTESVANQNVQFTFSGQYANASFNSITQGRVTTTFYPDNGTITGGTGDASNPWRTGNATAGSFATNPTPTRTSATDTSYTQIWSGITTSSAPKGIYVVFLKGQSGEPYPNASQMQVVTVNIADQKKQFFIDTSDAYVNAPSAMTSEQTVTYTLRVTDGTGQQSWNGGSGSITLQIDSCPSGGAATTCYFGSPGTQTVTTNVGGTATLTVKVPAGTADGLTLNGWIRAYGTDGESPARRVTRVLQVRTGTNVTAGGTTDYVDVLGFAVFEVTDVSDANDVKGRAVTPTKTDINDPALGAGKKYGLVPWETP